MVDTPTKVADVIVPEIFNPYVTQRALELNAFWKSGILSTPGDLTFGSRGGTKIEMPFWKRLGERAQLLDDNDDLEIRKIQAGQDTAVQHARALVYGATDLSAALAGSDPMRAIGDGLADNWSSEYNHVALASLGGAMGALAAESPTKNSYDISGLSGSAAYVDGASFIDASQLLGELKGQLTGIAMHSAVEAWLAKNDMIDTVRDSEGKIILSTFMNKTIVVDDTMAPESGGIYTSYLFGPGALGWGEGSPKVPTETDRDALKNGGEEFIVNRRHFVIHPRGIRWTPISGVPNKLTPSDAELANPANWTRVYDPKDIRIVRFRHKIG